jgi:hypothetical protein
MNITFKPTQPGLPEWFTYIEPASTAIPEWYQKMPLLIEGHKKLGVMRNSPDGSNLTLKGCTPMMDAFMAGYVFKLPADIQFTKDGDEIYANWRIAEKIMDVHNKEQYPGLPLIEMSKDSEIIFKVINPIQVITPKGYSCLFTHPLNRHDLPFKTFTGVVDTDVYPNPVNFPIQLNKFKDDMYILEKGTPIAQIIPFKRDDWESSYDKFEESHREKGLYTLLSKIVRSYKNQYWVKKTYS